MLLDEHCFFLCYILNQNSAPASPCTFGSQPDSNGNTILRFLMALQNCLVFVNKDRMVWIRYVSIEVPVIEHGLY